MSNTKDDLGQEIPGPAWFACMEFPGLDAGREIVRLRAELDAARKELEQQKAETLRAERWGETQFNARRKAEMESSAAALAVASIRSQRDAARTEADELRAQRDRAERLLQEQATQPVDRSTMPTVPPRVGYRYERRDRGVAEIVEHSRFDVPYPFRSRCGNNYAAQGCWWHPSKREDLDLVREIGPIEQGDKS